MSRIYVDQVLPETSGISENINLGASGDVVTLPAGVTLKTNKLTDAGGNNLITSDGSGNLTLDSGFQGAFKLITTNTFTDQAQSDFTSGISTSYNFYQFYLSDIIPATDNTHLQMQFQTGGSWTAAYKTSAPYYSWHEEDDGSSGITYSSSHDIANGTGAQVIFEGLDNRGHQGCGGEICLWNPAGTTWSGKGWTSEVMATRDSDRVTRFAANGICTITTAITGVRFNMSSGNFSGTIKMYGIGG